MNLKKLISILMGYVEIYNKNETRKLYSMDVDFRRKYSSLADIILEKKDIDKKLIQSYRKKANYHFFSDDVYNPNEPQHLDFYRFKAELFELSLDFYTISHYIEYKLLPIMLYKNYDDNSAIAAKKELEANLAEFLREINSIVYEQNQNKDSFIKNYRNYLNMKLLDFDSIIKMLEHEIKKLEGDRKNHMPFTKDDPLYAIFVLKNLLQTMISEKNAYLKKGNEIDKLEFTEGQLCCFSACADVKKFIDESQKNMSKAFVEVSSNLDRFSNQYTQVINAVVSELSKFVTSTQVEKNLNASTTKATSLTRVKSDWHYLHESVKNTQGQESLYEMSISVNPTRDNLLKAVNALNKVKKLSEAMHPPCRVYIVNQENDLTDWDGSNGKACQSGMEVRISFIDYSAQQKPYYYDSDTQYPHVTYIKELLLECWKAMQDEGVSLGYMRPNQKEIPLYGEAGETPFSYTITKNVQQDPLSEFKITSQDLKRHHIYPLSSLNCAQRFNYLWHHFNTAYQQLSNDITPHLNESDKKNFTLQLTETETNLPDYIESSIRSNLCDRAKNLRIELYQLARTGIEVKSSQICSPVPESYRQIASTSDDLLIKAKLLLMDYTKNNSLFGRVLHGHINRHHTVIIAAIIKDIDNNQYPNIENLLAKLREIPKNPKGSLARRVDFLEAALAESHYEDFKQLVNNVADENLVRNALTLAGNPRIFS